MAREVVGPSPLGHITVVILDEQNHYHYTDRLVLPLVVNAEPQDWSK